MLSVTFSTAKFMAAGHVADVVDGDNFIYCIQIPLMQDFIEVALNDCLVPRLICHRVVNSCYTKG